MSKAWVCILRCSDGSYYTGYTQNLEKRLNEHMAGEASLWTRFRLPFEVVFQQEMPDENTAFQAERQIKNWSRAKKEALIVGNFDLLKWLAKKPKYRKTQHPKKIEKKWRSYRGVRVDKENNKPKSHPPIQPLLLLGLLGMLR